MTRRYAFFKFAHSSSHSPRAEHSHPPTHPTTPLTNAADDEHTSSREETPVRKRTSSCWHLPKGLERRGCGGKRVGYRYRYDFTWKLSIFQTLPYMVMFTRLVHFARERERANSARGELFQPTKIMSQPPVRCSAQCV